MSVNNGIVTAPIGLEEVRRLIGCGKLDVGTVCGHDGINKFSKHKPYAFGGPAALTDTDRFNNNYGMTPAFVERDDTSSKIIGKPWGQWSCPGDGHWKRLTDFNNYSHKVRQYITAVSLRTNNPNNHLRLMGSSGGLGKGFLYADIQMGSWSDISHVLRIIDFHDPNTSSIKYEDWYFTLLVGPGEPDEGFASGKIYGVQRKVSECESNELINLKIEITDQVAKELNDGEGFYHARVCLAPKLTFDANGAISKSVIDWRQYVSLDMWGDGFITAILDSEVDDWMSSDVSTKIHVYGYCSYPATAFEFESDNNSITIRGADALTVYYDQSDKGVTFSNAHLWLAMALKNNSTGTIYYANRIPLAVSQMSGDSSFIQWPELEPVSVSHSVVRTSQNSSGGTIPAGTYTIMNIALSVTAQGARVANEDGDMFVYALYGDDGTVDQWIEAGGVADDTGVYTTDLTSRLQDKTLTLN